MYYLYFAIWEKASVFLLMLSTEQINHAGVKFLFLFFDSFQATTNAREPGNGKR